MSYFASGNHYDIDASIMITASHMPSDYNGLKITIEDVKPVTADMLQILRSIVGEHTFSAEEVTSNIVSHPIQSAWISHFTDRFNFEASPFSIVIDPANMVGALEIDTFRAIAGLSIHAIYDEFDHTSPNHEANPVKHDTLLDLGAEVRKLGANIGIAFDGDADRVGFVDELGTPVASDIIGILLAKKLLKEHPGSHIVYDVRSTRALSETIAVLGGASVQEKVGHTYIRTRMREHSSILGIELSGHFFFKESFYSEGGPLPAFLILDLMQEEGKTLRELASEAKRYHQSGEINSKIIRSAEDIFSDLRSIFPDAEICELDGLSLTMPTWWCNIRLSANDPVMRLNLESITREECDRQTSFVLEIIRRA
jgi:phosphomannomutase